VGEVVWKKGVLTKGNGLCQGITGNAVLLHSLFREFHRLSISYTGLVNEKFVAYY
jgi:hypothetical protein